MHAAAPCLQFLHIHGRQEVLRIPLLADLLQHCAHLAPQALQPLLSILHLCNISQSHHEGICMSMATVMCVHTTAAGLISCILQCTASCLTFCFLVAGTCVLAGITELLRLSAFSAAGRPPLRSAASCASIVAFCSSTSLSSSSRARRCTLADMATLLGEAAPQMTPQRARRSRQLRPQARFGRSIASLSVSVD